jgi:hypothetical protein
MLPAWQGLRFPALCKCPHMQLHDACVLFPNTGCGLCCAGWEAGFAVSPAAIVAGLSIPGVVIKQTINLQQLRMAMQLLVDFDRNQDARAGSRNPPAHAKVAALDKIH